MTALVIDGHPFADSLTASIAQRYTAAHADARLLALRDLDFDPHLRFGYRRRMTLEPDLIDAKAALARELAARFHTPVEADNAVAQWTALVREQRIDVDLPLVDIVVPAEGMRIAPLFVAAKLAASNSEVSRKLNERAVRIDGAVVEDRERVLGVGSELLLQVGKRAFARVRLVVG